jgi:hypothetical protein
VGAILHRQQMRRQFGISQQPSQGFTTEDRNWLQTQGIDRPDQLPRKSLWYRPDGSSSMGHSDAYHVARYHQRGMTLKAPVSAALEHQPARVPMPSIARQVLSLLGQEERWEGSASELAAIIGNRTPTGLSRLLGTAKVTAALSAEGITVKRGYKGNSRVLRLERRQDASVTSSYIRRQSVTLKKRATGTKSQMLSSN